MRGVLGDKGSMPMGDMECAQGSREGNNRRYVCRSAITANSKKKKKKGHSSAHTLPHNNYTDNLSNGKFFQKEEKKKKERKELNENANSQQTG